MTFFNYLFRQRKDNYTAIALTILLAAMYIAINVPYLTYIDEQSSLLAAHNPFYGAAFPLNLFNFDPSMQYGATNTSMIHPFINFLSGPLTAMANDSNVLYLALQSVLQGLSAALLYYAARRLGAAWLTALLTAALFGVSSYSLFTAMIPDSYVYAQLGIILSAVYLQYCRSEHRFGIAPNAALALLNFGITTTNVITFYGALIFSMLERSRKTVMQLIKITSVFLGLVIVVTVLQHFLFSGSSWITNWLTSLQQGGFSYVTPFSFAHHARVFHMLIISPMLTPDIALIDTGIQAFVTDLSKPYPIHVQIVGFGMILLALLGLIQNIRSRGAWAWVIYILFGLFLHVGVGFGLAAYSYDMYLYAGHYLFAFFILSAMFIAGTPSRSIQNLCNAVLVLFLIIILANNIWQHMQVLDYIETTFNAVFGEGNGTL